MFFAISYFNLLNIVFEFVIISFICICIQYNHDSFDFFLNKVLHILSRANCSRGKCSPYDLLSSSFLIIANYKIDKWLLILHIHFVYEFPCQLLAILYCNSDKIFISLDILKNDFTFSLFWTLYCSLYMKSVVCCMFYNDLVLILENQKFNHNCLDISILFLNICQYADRIQKILFVSFQKDIPPICT